MRDDYFDIDEGAGPVEGMFDVPDLPLLGPPGTFEMVGLLFGLVWSVAVPEVAVPPAPLTPELELVDGLVP